MNIKSNKMRFQILTLVLLIATTTLLGGCFFDTTSKETTSEETTSASEPEVIQGDKPPITSTISVVADPSLEAVKNKDAYAQISEHVLEAYNPDKALYNTLFNAIDNMETTVDISGFPLSMFEKVAVCDSLYEQAGLQFYYVDRIKVSGDGNSALISYTSTGEEAQTNKEIFYAKLGHLIYNVAPENYSPLQKLFSIYDYISENATYTDDMQDVSTHTAYSILMNGKGICGGFSSLGYTVLNQVGIQAKYISNEAHAWNMVELAGKNYHTDITWGVSNYGSSVNSLRTILMDDTQRNLSLDQNGYGGFAIIEGFPRLNPVSPQPAPNNDFKTFYDLYFEYALDIDNNWVYYYDGEGIKRMTLEGKAIETVSQMPATYLTAFNGSLYFINPNSRQLYRLQPGKEPELLDDSLVADKMTLKKGILNFQMDDGSISEKTLNLNPFIQSNFDLNNSEHLQPVTLPMNQSFKFQIAFSDDMLTDVLPREYVTLVNQEGQTLPVHMFWNEDHRTLTVRSKESLDIESSVSLYVSPGIASANGNKSIEMFDVTVERQRSN